jgi:energy-coupling factor transporter ATP-binding protein EcfA2
VVVLDEPTAGLDTAAKESTLGYVMAYCKAHSATLVFTTHDPDVALAWATHTLALVPAAPIA